MRSRRIAVIASIAIAALSLAACGDKAMEPFKDAPTSGRNNQPAEVIDMPDGFSNAATKCDNGNRLYVAYKADDNRAAIAVVPSDPTCKGQ